MKVLKLLRRKLSDVESEIGPRKNSIDYNRKLIAKYEAEVAELEKECAELRKVISIIEGAASLGAITEEKGAA